MNNVKELARIIKEMNLSELEYKDDNFEVKFKNNISSSELDFNSKKDTLYKANIDNEEKEEILCQSNKNIYIESNLIGTFYSKPSPEENAYVNKNDIVKKGQVVCIIESMKLMNELKAPYDCKIVDILVNDGDLVEFGENIFLVEEI